MGAAPSSPTKTEAEPCKRIRKELHRMWVDPPAFCRPGASPVTNLLHWEVVIDGPEGSPYAGGTFPVDVKFTGDHPMNPPKITFKAKVYHPNIDSEGQMVLDIFQENWSPALTIEKLLLSVVSVLYDPMLDSPINGHIARLYKSNIKLYERKARAWTRRYASTPVASYYPEKGDENWEDYCDAIAAHNAELEEERRREAERFRAAAAASSAHHKVAASRREKGLNLLWRPVEEDSVVSSGLARLIAIYRQGRSRLARGINSLSKRTKLTLRRRRDDGYFIIVSHISS